LEGAEEQSFRKITATLTDRFALLLPHGQPGTVSQYTILWSTLGHYFTYLIRIRMTVQSSTWSVTYPNEGCTTRSICSLS